MAGKPHAAFSPKISRTRVFDLTRTCDDDKQRIHIPKTVEMADYGGARRGRWRFKPGTPARVRIPITFVLTGAQH
jgi:hypothetical protein